MVDVDMVSETLIPFPERLSPFEWVFVDGSFRRTDEARTTEARTDWTTPVWA
jgi:hypothetical protein